MTTTDKEFLAQYHEQLKTALHDDYCRYIPRREIQRMAEICTANGVEVRGNANCPRCALNIVKKTAALYFNNETATNYAKKRRSTRKSADTEAND